MYEKNTKSRYSVWIGIMLGIVLFLAFIIWACLTHTVVAEPGTEVVLVDNPYFVGNEGIRPEPLREGRKLLWVTTRDISVTVSPTSERIVIDDFSSSNNILLDFESTIQYRVTNSPALIRGFGKEWFTNNISQQYLSLVRDVVKTKTMEEMMSNQKVANELDIIITESLRKLVVDSKLPIEILNVSLGRAKPNADVLAQINKTAAEQQRLKTLIQATAAEKQREAEQEARAIADNAYRNKMSLSPEQFVQLEAIKRYSEACAKSTCVIGTSAHVMVNQAR